MKNSVLVLGFMVLIGALTGSPAMAASDGQKAATKTAVQVTRMGVGAAVGGTAGKLIMGGPVGAALGAFITPSETGCFKGEQCAKWGTVVDPKPAKKK